MDGSRYNYDDLTWQKPIEPEDNEYFFAPASDAAVPHGGAVDVGRSRTVLAGVVPSSSAGGRKRRFRFLAG